RPAVEERWREEAPSQRTEQRAEQRAEPRRDQRVDRPPQRAVRQDIDPVEDVDVEGDIWDEPVREEELIEAKPLIIPKKKVMEYEEETDY
ncbi:MAG: hypothetical protein ACR2FS_11035, partial [Phormidesmis sp.]